MKQVMPGKQNQQIVEIFLCQSTGLANQAVKSALCGHSNHFTNEGWHKKMKGIVEVTLAPLINPIFLSLFLLAQFSCTPSTIKGTFDAEKGVFFQKNKQYRVGNFVEGYATVSKDGKFGFINKTGKLVKPITQTISSNFTAPLPLPVTDAVVGILHLSWLVDSPINSLCNGNAPGTYFICDTTGKILVPHILSHIPYRGPEANSQGLQVTESGAELIYYTTYKQDYEKGSIEEEFCNRCKICLGNMGIIDTSGKEIVSADRYGYISKFTEGRAIVVKGKFGFIDENGTEVIPCIYDDVKPFSAGKSLVTLNGETFTIGKDGKRYSK